MSELHISLYCCYLPSELGKMADSSTGLQSKKNSVIYSIGLARATATKLLTRSYAFRMMACGMWMDMRAFKGMPESKSSMTQILLLA